MNKNEEYEQIAQMVLEIVTKDIADNGRMTKSLEYQTQHLIRQLSGEYDVRQIADIVRDKL